jgi:Iap family predicted aminopeptidase
VTEQAIVVGGMVVDVVGRLLVKERLRVVDEVDKVFVDRPRRRASLLAVTA